MVDDNILLGSGTSPVLVSIFKPSVRWPLAGARLIAFVHEVSISVYVRVCVRPRGYKLNSRDIEPVQPAEQV